MRCVVGEITFVTVYIYTVLLGEERTYLHKQTYFNKFVILTCNIDKVII